MKENTSMICSFEELPLMLTVEEAAKALRIGRNAAYELTRAGTLRSIKIGRQYRIPKDAIEEYIRM